MDGVTYYTALPEGHCDQYEMVMSTDFEAACDERDAALAREAALREQCGGMQMSLDEAAEREAALREELADLEDEFDTLEHSNIDLKLKNSEAMTLLHMAKELLSTISLHRTMAPSDWCESFKAEVADRLEKLRAVTQPTESGASDRAIRDLANDIIDGALSGASE